MHKKSIFIIEDDAMYGKLLKAFIENSFPDLKEVKIFPIGEMSLMELQENPAVIIIDYFLNSKYPEAHNGLEIIKQIKSQKPKTNIIILSSQDSPGVIMEAIRDFDCRYVQKDKEAFHHVEKLIKEFLSHKRAASLEPWV
jgi:two-component system OmpR family response regulator